MKKTISPTIPTNFERIFHPQNIAIIGVSTENGGSGFGSRMFLAIKAMGFDGKIFPVNPKGGNLDELQIYRQVEDIPEKVDFAIITVAAKLVPGVLEGCRKKGIEGVEILSAGFSELGTEAGKELENKIQQIAAAGIRVVGPNCFGIYCPQSGLHCFQDRIFRVKPVLWLFFLKAEEWPLTLPIKENGWAFGLARWSALAMARICGKRNYCNIWRMIQKQK